VGQKEEWEKAGKGRCEHVSGLAVLLEECLGTWSSNARKFVLVLDEIDRQREAPPTLLSALARLGEIVSWFWISLALNG
jgi:origin recognition complex subunit 5